MRPWWTPLAALAVAALAGGCGSVSDGTPYSL